MTKIKYFAEIPDFWEHMAKIIDLLKEHKEAALNLDRLFDIAMKGSRKMTIEENVKGLEYNKQIRENEKEITKILSNLFIKDNEKTNK